MLIIILYTMLDQSNSWIEKKKKKEITRPTFHLLNKNYNMKNWNKYNAMYNLIYTSNNKIIKFVQD